MLWTKEISINHVSAGLWLAPAHTWFNNQTENLNKTVNLQGIDGLAFMSPSAVYSLAQNGGFKNLPCFAIGTTTALALKDEGQKCMISKTTNAKSLVDIAKHYLNK